MPSMYYLRTRDGVEIDLVLEVNQKLHLFEIKSSSTILPKHARSLQRIAKDIDGMVKTTAIISLAQENYSIGKNVMQYSWKNLLGF